MSKKNKKEKSNKVIYLEGDENYHSASEMDCIIGAILDYYSSTSKPPLEDGDEWKQNTDYEPEPIIKIPKEIDEEIKKSFLFQIKKFQK